MSTLTKVFIVLLVVFSIAFTTMTVSIVARTANWRQLAEDFDQHAVVADTNLRHMIAADAAQLVGANEVIAGYRDEVDDLNVKLEERGHTIAQLRSELTRAASEKSNSEAMNRALLAQLQGAEAARKEYRDQRDALETRNIELERRNIDLDDRVNELTARTMVLLEQKRQAEQQVNILRAENEKIARASRRPSTSVSSGDGSGVMPHVSAITPVASSPIRGQILEVSGNIVTISVGASDGVKKDMVFVVHRGDQYLGDLKVTLVESDEAAGRTVSSGFVPQAGDQVTDALTLGASRG